MSFDFGLSAECGWWVIVGRLRRCLVALQEMAEEIVGVNELVLLIAEEVGPYCM